MGSIVMRRLIVATALIAIVSPASAASRHSEDAEVARTAEKLNDPLLQSSLAGMMIAMTDALMDVRVDKLRDAIGRIDPDSRAANNDHRDNPRTVGDMVERDNPEFRRNIADGSRRAMATMGAAAAGMASMLPELREMGERMGRQMEKAMSRIPAS